MIALGDARSDAGMPNFNANLDPVINDAADNDASWHTQVPGNRHNYRPDLMFCDGHAESPRRNDAINPNDPNWRSKWDNDNDAHMDSASDYYVAPWPMSNVDVLEQQRAFRVNRLRQITRPFCSQV